MHRLAGGSWLFLPLLLGASPGCSRRSDPPRGSIDAAAIVFSVSGTDDGATAPSRLISPAVFSAPIAAARLGRDLVVAGWVASEGVIRVMALRGGPPIWTVDVLRGVAWIPDAELKLEAAGEGLAVVWRGNRDGKRETSLVVVGSQGELRGDPISIGAASCASADGLAWIEPRSRGPARVLTRRWDDPTPHDAVTVAPDRSPALSCGDHEVFVLGDGDDDLTATAFSPMAPARTEVVAIRDRDFGDDDEREHEVYMMGDDLGIVRIGAGGGIALRDIAHGRASPWHRLKHSLSAVDDVVAVDADSSSTLLVVAREATHACPGGEAEGVTVRALRVDRKTNEEVTIALAPADCDGAPGPFWIAEAPGASAIAWAHRKTKSGSNAPPIDSLMVRRVTGDRTTPGEVDLQADALVDAGCDHTGCFAAALLRAPEADGGDPESILGIRYLQ